jgi:hypothetical protein
LAARETGAGTSRNFPLASRDPGTFFPNFEFAFCLMSGMRLRENRIELKTLDGGKNRENNGGTTI